MFIAISLHSNESKYLQLIIYRRCYFSYFFLYDFLQISDLDFLKKVSY